MGGPGGTGGGGSGGGKREDKKLQNAIVNGVLQNTENTSKETEPDCLVYQKEERLIRKE